MKNYSKHEPLIIIHTPKTAGTSVRAVFESWFRPNFRTHYFDWQQKAMPKRHDIEVLHSKDKPLAIYGHFNSDRGFGVQDYYPEAAQFITILRDPFEMMVSRYFYLREQEVQRNSPPRLQLMDLVSYLRQEKVEMLNFFPREVTSSNYKDIIEQYFVEVGVTDKLAKSLARIAKKLGYEFDEGDIQHMNKSKKIEEFPAWYRKEYVDKHPLEFAVYEYALSRYA